MCRSFVEDNPKVRWCPAPNCIYAVEILNKNLKDVLCKCGAHWCFQCGDEAHRPLNCKLYREWITKREDKESSD